MTEKMNGRQERGVYRKFCHLKKYIQSKNEKNFPFAAELS